MSEEVLDARRFVCPFCHERVELFVPRAAYLEVYVLHECKVCRKPAAMLRQPLREELRGFSAKRRAEA